MNHPSPSASRAFPYHLLPTLAPIAMLLLVAASSADEWRPPAYPLVACDPYFSIWSQGETIVEAGTTHWTGKPNRLVSLARVDGKTYRLLGGKQLGMEAFAQKSQQVLPTRSLFELEGAGVAIELTFTTPALPYDIDTLSRPITYVSYRVRSIDDAEHQVELLLAASGEIAVNTPDQLVAAETVAIDGAQAQRVGSVSQRVLARAGDDLRIEWGYLYLAADEDELTYQTTSSPEQVIAQFEAAGSSQQSRRAVTGETAGGELMLAVAFRPITAGSEPAERWAVLAYDDLYSIEFMQRPLRPYWRRNGLDGEGLVAEALRDYQQLTEKCVQFDQELMADLAERGGDKYADIAALAYRQCFAAGKFVADANGQPLQFSKENHSNGCIATSDVFYPMAPQVMLFGSSLAKSFVAPFMEYAESDRWKFPFAPHDLGTYPKANGQVYGGGETSECNQMPVEESGNMLLLMAVISRLDGNAEFANGCWPRLVEWAEYLHQQGYDPESQLCTDDFAGHLAHNVNLSAKAICGLGAFAQVCELNGKPELADKYRTAAEQFAEKWQAEANSGDHYRLAFDKPDTWSQKYNLVWDRILGLGLYPDSVLETEMKWYRKVQNEYGLPLDNRKEYTKLDWILWTATLTQNRSDFEALVAPVHKFLDESPDRSPMTDWYFTDSGKKRGFTARPVVGGVFLQMLYDDTLWKKWAGRDQTNAGNFADLPTPPTITPVLPSAESDAVRWQYSLDKPSGDWQSPDYDDSAWQRGTAGFGSRGTPSAVVGTEWTTSDIWLRQSFDLPDTDLDSLRLQIHHDEAAEVYLNGERVAQLRGYTTSYTLVPLGDDAIALLKPQGNVIAIHCHQTTGGQYIDAGLVKVEDAP